MERRAPWLNRLRSPFTVAWLAVLGATGAMMWLGKSELRWAFKVPGDIRLPLRSDISAGMKWLIEEADLGPFTFFELTRSIAWLLDYPLHLATSLLSTGLMQGQGSQAVQILPPISWIAVALVMMLMGRYAKGAALALLMGGCFFYLAVFGQWASAMVTLSSIAIAVPLGILGGLTVGILVHFQRWLERIVTPILDLMQTVPVFAYLVPILFLFGFGPVAAMIATIIYAMPPMVRVTMLALRQVPGELLDLGEMTGCTTRQMLFKVLIPSAKSSLMVGVNQVIMLSLNMVIIASMIGAGGLGYDVLAALRRLDIGAGVEAGLAIVVLAIALDRLSQAFAVRPQPAHEEHPAANPLRRHPFLAVSAALIVGSVVLGLILPAVTAYPESLTITTGPFWSDLVKYINVNFFDQLEAVKTFLLVNLMVPVKRFLLSLPWPAVALMLGLAGLQLGGWRVGLLVLCLSLFMTLTNLWDKTMVTVYLCGISVAMACVIGIPIGVLAAESNRLGRIVQLVIDTLQTLPSFVYLIPVVMLFRVGDFSAMIAVVAYALAPAIRYSMHGIRQVDPHLVEAGVVAGCTPWQVLTKIKIKLALPEIMLGINQTIMLALSMLVITALVGTRELGQEVYIALTKADTGRGIVAGLSVAFIAIIADRLITAGVARSRARLGLD